MAGHNKWSKIKHKKAAGDAKKSKEFSKLARLIASESKKSGGDKNSPGLRAAIEKARSINMPSDNIERAVKKGSGSDAGEMFETIYESYGPGGCAIIIESLTDNKNRTSAEIKHLLSQYNTTLAEQGSASWAFEKTSEGMSPKTTIKLPAEDAESLKKLVSALEDNDDVQKVYTNAAE